jgi:hypothetical protein
MGSSSKKTQQSSRSDYNLPDYMNQGSQRAVQMATNRTNQAYENYGGTRIAGLSQNEQMGVQGARENFGAYNQDFDSARTALDAAGGSITDECALEGYMNPYMEQVLAPQRRRQNEAFDAERASRRSTRGMKNAFGGRGDMWDNKFESDFQTRQDELTGSAYGAAFDSATGLYSAERDRDIRRAGAYSNLAESQSSQNRQAIRDLMATGITERTRDQADLDFQYLEHLEGRDWDVSNLNTLVQTLAAVPHESSQTTESTTTETQSQSPLQTIAGIGAIGVGAIMTGGASLAGGASFWGPGGVMETVGGALMGSEA